MRKSELDDVLATMLDSHNNVSDLNVTVDHPLQVEASGELVSVPVDVFPARSQAGTPGLVDHLATIGLKGQMHPRACFAEVDPQLRRPRDACRRSRTGMPRTSRIAA